jgi:hypothetical protein
MLTGPQIGYLGGIIGSILGTAGGLFGTYCSIKNTKGPLERRFMIKASSVVWIALSIFLGMLFALPAPYRYLVWIPYGIFVPLGIRFINKRQREIQAEEQVNFPGLS